MKGQTSRGGTSMSEARNATYKTTKMRNLAKAMLVEILSQEAVEREPTSRLPSLSSDRLQWLALDLDNMLFDAASTSEDIESKAKDVIATGIRFLIDFNRRYGDGS